MAYHTVFTAGLEYTLYRARHFIGTQATGAGVDVAGRSIHNCLNALYIGLPFTIASSVGVGNLNSKRYTFSADIALGHGLHLLCPGCIRHTPFRARKVNSVILSDFPPHCKPFYNYFLISKNKTAKIHKKFFFDLPVISCFSPFNCYNRNTNEREDALFVHNDIYTWFARAIVLFTAMPIHEYSHGLAANRLGDGTARHQGRLTLNPLAHLDLLGSLLLIFAGFGWAKPVEVDVRNFKRPKRDMAITALAGPVSNIFLATAVMIVYKLMIQAWPILRYQSHMVEIVLTLLAVMITTNLYLAVFNLLPVPPLDGAKIFGIFLPDRYYFFVMRYERYISLIVFVLIFTGILSRPLSMLANSLLQLIDTATFFLGRVA